MRPFSQRGRDALYGISAEKVAELCGVHITTARRWKRYGDAPLSALKVMRLYDTGDLAAVDPAWSGWKIRGGELLSPDGAYSFTAGMVQAIPFMQQLINHYQDKQRLPAQADWVSERWITTAAFAAEA